MEKFRKYQLPNEIQDLIEQRLNFQNLSLKDSSRLAECVQRLSDFYIGNPKGESPWSHSWAETALTAYYFPLNFLRNTKVIEEADRIGFFDGLDTCIDFGSGPGTTSWALFMSQENSHSARQPARKLRMMTPVPKSAKPMTDAKKMMSRESSTPR